MIVGSTQLSVVFYQTWRSSMMFSSTLTIVQSSGPSDDSLVLRPPALSFAAWPCACCTLNEAPTLGLLHVLLLLTPVDSRHTLQLCHLVSHGPDSSWDCRRVLHRIPPNELDQLFSSSCLQLGSFALRQERVLGPSNVSLSSNNKTSSPRPQS